MFLQEREVSVIPIVEYFFRMVLNPIWTYRSSFRLEQIAQTEQQMVNVRYMFFVNNNKQSDRNATFNGIQSK